VIKRLEQERDLARDNIGRLEEERNALRERLKVLKCNLLELSKLHRIKFLHTLSLSSCAVNRAEKTRSVPSIRTIVL
jgi:hypothetical protein